MNGVKQNGSSLKYLNSDYIQNLFKSEDEAIYAISDLIEDLHTDKMRTANYIINQKDIKLYIYQFLKLLRGSLPTIVGNTAYILGTIAEFDEGRSKIIEILSNEDFDINNSLDLLISLLGSQDSETLLNVTGTIGSLVESTDGRCFILSKNQFVSNLLHKVDHLLLSTDLWIASNAALVIARLIIDDDGKGFLLKSSILPQIIANLVACLTVDTAGRGMNAAFALGRILDNGLTIEAYYVIIYKLKMIEKLTTLMECSEMAFVKNACFCISSIMGSDKGYLMVVSDPLFDQIVAKLANIASQDDDEAVWFGILTLKIISKNPTGCKFLRKTGIVLNIMKKCIYNVALSNDVREECQTIINNLTPLERPTKPNVTLISPYEVLVSWIPPRCINYMEINSFLYYKHDEDEVLAYKGKKCEVSVHNLEPNQRYEFYLKFANVIEITNISDICTITTAEDYPSEPTNLHLITRTSNQIKIGWDEPVKMNGNIKHYIVQISKRTFELTNERSSIISGLQPETKYCFSVSAVNNCGRGLSTELEANTLSSGAHAPERPNVIMLGRSVAHITWNAPESLKGKFFRYDVKMNQKLKIYSGSHTYCKVTNLKPDTEYAFSVIVVTSEGKFESPICRKKSGRDEYAGSYRPPLYDPKSKPESGDCSSNRRDSSSFHLPTNLMRAKRNSLSFNVSNAELETSHKSPQLIVTSTRFPGRQAPHIENSQPTMVALKENNGNCSTKLQPLLPSQSKSKPGMVKSYGDSLSVMSGYTNSMSIPSLSSADINMICDKAKQ